MVARLVGCDFDTYGYKEVKTVVIVLFFLIDTSSWTFGVSWTPSSVLVPPAFVLLHRFAEPLTARISIMNLIQTLIVFAFSAICLAVPEFVVHSNSPTLSSHPHEMTAATEVRVSENLLNSSS